MVYRSVWMQDAKGDGLVSKFMKTDHAAAVADARHDHSLDDDYEIRRSDRSRSRMSVTGYDSRRPRPQPDRWFAAADSADQRNPKNVATLHRTRMLVSGYNAPRPPLPSSAETGIGVAMPAPMPPIDSVGVTLAPGAHSGTHPVAHSGSVSDGMKFLRTKMKVSGYHGSGGGGFNLKRKY